MIYLKASTITSLWLCKSTVTLNWLEVLQSPVAPAYLLCFPQLIRGSSHGRYTSTSIMDTASQKGLITEAKGDNLEGMSSVQFIPSGAIYFKASL